MIEDESKSKILRAMTTIVETKNEESVGSMASN